MGLFEKVYCNVCGQRIKGSYKAIKDLKRGRLAYNLCLSCNDKFEAITHGKSEYPLIPEKMRQIITSGVNIDGSVESRMRCNVCGEIFCYSDDDLARNRALQQDAAKARNSALWEALGGTNLAANQYTSRADSYEAQIIDYSKCPKCHSSNLTALSKEEFESCKNNSAGNNNSSPSAADEIKKFKDLLDAGIITQEEFDTKKKQLLGL